MSNWANQNTKIETTSSMGFCGFLTLIFIVLKLCNIVSWSWFWVLSPTIFSAGLALIVFIIILLLVVFDRYKS